MMPRTVLALLLSFSPAVLVFAVEPPAGPPRAAELFRRENLVAWCIVPFDAAKRTPAQRAEMLDQLGFRHFAYDWRAEHLPTLETELAELERRHIELTAVWFPTSLNADARFILDLLRRHHLKTQLWVSGGGEPTANYKEKRRRIEAEAARIRPIAEAAQEIGCQVGLYNHGGWFGEPENQLAIIDALGLPNVGIVYNLHHGHDHLDRLPELLRKTLPRLLAVNINGTFRGGDKRGLKIVPLGQGELDLEVLLVILHSGYRGPIGILGHTQDDARARLQDNLDGLAWLVPQLDGQPAGPPPVPRTFKPAKASRAAASPQAAAPKPAPANDLPPPGVHLTGTDPNLKVTLIDRSPAEVYMAVKADTQGQIFVGGREALFVFQPDGDGYRRRELLRFPADSIIIGLEFRGNDLYVLTCNALYRIPQGRLARDGLKPERILWGLPLDLHVSFHCLAWGPDGDLYLSHGDPLLGYGDWSRPDHWGHWTLYAGPTGTPVPYTGQGAVLRVRPDGSNPRRVAGGLRGPVGLAFDPRGNLFTNDNDHESRADLYAPARLLHVTPHIDFAWPRGWMASMSPDRADLVEPMSADLGRGVPCDLAWYDEPLLADLLPGRLLMCRWDRRAVTSYPLRPRGASFGTQEATLLEGANDARPVGIAVDCRGRLLVTVLYMAGNMAAPQCASDVLLVSRAKEAEAAAYAPYDPEQASADLLWRELSQPAWQRRSRAHQEILRRGGPMLAEAVRRLEAKQDGPDRLHLPWLAAAGKSARAAELLTRLSRDPDVELRLQALRALGSMRSSPEDTALFSDSLVDTDARVQLAALNWFFEAAAPLPLERIVTLARSDDTYLRQTATTLMAARARPEELQNLLSSPDDATRLAGVLAVGHKLTVPDVHSRPDERVPLFYPQEGNFFKTRQYFYGQAEPTNLAGLGRVGAYTMAQHWKATEHSAKDQRLFGLLERALGDANDRVRLQSAYWLSLLRDPRTDAVVERLPQEITTQRLEKFPAQLVARAWVVGPFESGPPKPDGRLPEQSTLDLSATYATAAGPKPWDEAAAVDGAFRFSQTNPAAGDNYLTFQLQSRTRQAALLHVEGGASPRLWQNGTALDPQSGSNVLLDLQPGSNEILMRLSIASGKSPVRIAVRTADTLSMGLAEKIDSNQLAERLREAASAGAVQSVPSEFVSVDWPAEARSGNPGRGRRLFAALACVKCHAIAPGQKSGGGPSLVEANRRFTVPYVVESILLPSKQVAEPFRSTTIVTTDGRALSGLVVAESAADVELLLSDTSRTTVPKSQIDERAGSVLSPMPVGLVKTPEELRDLLAYVLSERPSPP
jgi:putative heme-binding domain-containing protein